MMDDFSNFVILYVLLTVMFATVGNMNFLYELKEFDGLFASVLTVIDASLGNFQFNIFDEVRDEGMQLFGQIMIMIIVISFNMLLLNLIIAILANTYNMFDLRATGLYLSKILNTRGELIYDENYGSFLAAIPPINIIQLPFIPIALSLRKGHPLLLKVNNWVMMTQYCIFMIIFYTIFVAVSLVCIPFAWIIGVYDKLTAKNTNRDTMDKVFNYLFILWGPLILIFDVFADTVYFWKNNFRVDLKKNIIVKD